MSFILLPMPAFETNKMQNDTKTIKSCSFLIIINIFIFKCNICDNLILCVYFYNLRKRGLKMNVIRNVMNRNVMNVSLSIGGGVVILSLFLGLFFIPSTSSAQSLRAQLRQCLANLEDQQALTLLVRQEKAKAFTRIHNLNNTLSEKNDILSKVNGGCVLEEGDNGKLNVDHDSLSSTGSPYSDNIASVSLKCVDANLLFTNLNTSQTCVNINTSDSESHYKQKRYVSIKTVTLNSGSTYYLLRGSKEELRMLWTDSDSSHAKEAVFRRGPGSLLSIDPDSGGEVGRLFATSCDYNPSDPFCMGYYGIISVSTNSTGAAYNYVSGTDVRIINGQEVHSMLAQFDRTLTVDSGDSETIIQLADLIYEKSDLLQDTTTDLYTDNANYIPMLKELKSRLPRIVSGELTAKDWSFCSEDE